MREYLFKKTDAFATEKSAGNPAAYILLNSLQEISESEMLQIAKELKGFVNEVGYVARVSEGEFDMRYYSAEREVDFCGHATVAIMYDMICSCGSLSVFDTLIINTKRGKLPVYNRLSSEDSVFIMSPVPVFKDEIPDISVISHKLKIQLSEINVNYPVSIINAGLNTLIVPVKDLNVILGIKPEFDELRDFCIKSKTDIIEVFTSEVAEKKNDYRVRVFAPTFGYLEDPATGSGNAAFGYYLIKNHLWKKGIIKIEQNGLRTNYNLIKLQKQSDENNQQRVCFGGGAITRIKGKYLIYC